MTFTEAEKAEIDAAANRLEQIKQEVLAKLGDYVKRTEHLTSTGLIGTAGIAFMVRVRRDCERLEAEVTQGFDKVIEATRTGPGQVD
jgi:hypothetical protein